MKTIKKTSLHRVLGRMLVGFVSLALILLAALLAKPLFAKTLDIKAYTKEMAATQPQYTYVYGETGWKGGGRFRPHRTHREGLTADFMTPMLINGPDGKAIPARLPSSMFNLWRYNIRLDSDGAFKKMRLDSKAMIAHLAALKKTAPQYGLRIERVIFDPPLLKFLRRDPAFSQLHGITFMNGQAWFPHDGHYHVDFK